MGDVNDPQSLEKARQVRLALNLAVNKKAIIDGLWKGTGSETPFMYWFYPFNKGYSAEWKIPYGCAARQKTVGRRWLRQRFEITVNPMVFTYALDGPDVMEAVALDWEKLGIGSSGRRRILAIFCPRYGRARPARRAGSCLAAL